MNINIQMGACVLIHTICTAEIGERVNEALAIPTANTLRWQEQLGGVRPGH